MMNFRSLSPFSNSLSECTAKLEDIKKQLQNDQYLLSVGFAFDTINSINKTKRDACVAQLDEIMKMIEKLSDDVSSVIVYENAWEKW